MKRWILALTLVALTSLACGGSWTAYAPSHATEWKVERAVYEHYTQKQFDRAGEIWCNGTGSRYCPTFSPVMPDETPNVVMGVCKNTSSFCYKNLRLLLEMTDAGDCFAAALAHELGHAIGLTFPDSPGKGGPRHHSDPDVLMHVDTNWKTGVCSPSWELDDTTRDAFEVVYELDVTSGP